MADELETGLANLLTDREVADLVVDGAGLALDQLADSNVIEKIPIVGHIATLYRAGLRIRDYLFLRKLGTFLGKLSDVPETEREAFSAQLAAEPKLRRRVGEHLLIVLDRLNDLEKPVLLALVFRAHIKGRIEFETLRRLSDAIDRCLVSDLQKLQGFVASSIDASVAHGLSSAGLLEIDAVPTIRPARMVNRYRITDLGSTFVEEVLDQQE